MGATELWQVRYCTTSSKGQLWGRGPRLTALVHRWRSCCLWAFLDRQIVGRDTGAECPRGAEGHGLQLQGRRIRTGGDSSHTGDGQNAVGHQGCLGGKLWTQALFCKPTGWEDDSVVCQTFLLVWATGYLPNGGYSRADTQVSCKMKLAAGQTDLCLEGLFSQLSFNPHSHLTGQNLENRLFW